VLLGAAVALAIALPLTLKGTGSNSNKGNSVPVTLQSEGSGLAKDSGKTRTYYLAADPIDWDYAPAGKDLCRGEPFAGQSLLYTTSGIGTKYKKAVYREYEDGTFTVSGQLLLVMAVWACLAVVNVGRWLKHLSQCRNRCRFNQCCLTWAVKPLPQPQNLSVLNPQQSVLPSWCRRPAKFL